MSTDYGVKTVQPGQQTIYNVPANSGWVVIQNESPYKLSCSMDGTGSTRAIPIQSIDKLTIPTSGFNGNIVLTPVSILNQQAVDQAPSYEVNLEAFGANEEPTGVYPVALSRSVQVGGTVTAQNVIASQVIDRQVGGANLTVGAKVAGDLFDNLQLYNTGDAHFGSGARHATVAIDLLSILRFLGATLPGPVQQQIDMYVSNVDGSLNINGSAAASPATLNLFTGSVASGGASVDFTNGRLAVNTTPTVINGSTSGTATCYMPFTGVFKLVVVIASNFRNGGASPQNYTLPAPFTSGCCFLVGETNPFTLRNGGVGQTSNTVTTLASTGGTATAATSIFRDGFGYCANPFDTISFNSGEVGAHSGVSVFIGI